VDEAANDSRAQAGVKPGLLPCPAARYNNLTQGASAA